jgi:hypothetical protein
MASDNNSVSDTSVTKETIKGVAKGAAAPFVAAGVTAAGTAVLATAVVAPPVAAYKLSGKIHQAAGGGWKGAAAVAAVWAAGLVVSTTAAIGGMLGFGKGLAKSGSEKPVRTVSNEQAMADTIQAAQQQAYLMGARDGQIHMVNEIQKAQEAQMAKAQETTAGFAAKVAQTKNSITPEAIAKQREAAAAASTQVG